MNQGSTMFRRSWPCRPIFIVAEPLFLPQQGAVSRQRRGRYKNKPISSRRLCCCC
jgi:hypothetical protein